MQCTDRLRIAPTRWLPAAFLPSSLQCAVLAPSIFTCSGIWTSSWAARTGIVMEMLRRPLKTGSVDWGRFLRYRSIQTRHMIKCLNLHGHYVQGLKACSKDVKYSLTLLIYFLITKRSFIRVCFGPFWTANVVTLRLTVSQYVAVWNLRSCFYGAPSLTRGRVCNLQCNHSMVRVAQNP
jgi:hypothetical protein